MTGRVDTYPTRIVLLLQLGVVTAYSTAPLLFSLGGASHSPFFFVAVANGCIMGVLCVYVLVAGTGDARRIVAGIKGHWRRRSLMGAAVGQTHHVFFALSLLFVDVAVAAVLLASRPLFSTLVLDRAFRDARRYGRLACGKWGLFALGWVGCGLVIANQGGGAGVMTVGFPSWGGLLGLLLALVASFVVGFAMLSVKWGVDVSVATGVAGSEVLYSVVGHILSLAGSIIVLCVLGLLTDEPGGEMDSIGWFFASGFGMAAGVGVIMNKVVLLKTGNLGIVSLSYLQPALALAWLTLFMSVDVGRVDWLLWGLFLIVGANILLNRQ